MKTIFESDLPTVNAAPAFHPRKPTIVAVACGDLRFWDLRAHARVSLLASAPTHGVQTVVFSPDGKSIALGMQDGGVSIWNLDTGVLRHEFREHSDLITSLCFSSNGRLLASGGSDGRAVVYSLGNGVNTPLKHADAVFGVAFAPDDKTLVSASWDGNIRFWCLANYQVALTLTHDRGPVNWIAFSTNGNLMATSGTAGKAILWPADSIKEIESATKPKTQK